MFLGIILVITPPNVSRPRDNGVTSRRTTSFTSPAKTPPCTAAPRETTSSGLTVTLGSFPVIFFTRSCTAGILVEPPTRITSSMSLNDNFASLRALSTGVLNLSRRSEHSSSNLALVRVVSICLGPSAVAVMKGKLIFVWVKDDSSIFAFSAASVRRCKACLSFSRSIPSSFLKFPASQSTTLLSKSSPPR